MRPWQFAFLNPQDCILALRIGAFAFSRALVTAVSGGRRAVSILASPRRMLSPSKPAGGDHVLRTARPGRWQSAVLVIDGHDGGNHDNSGDDGDGVDMSQFTLCIVPSSSRVSFAATAMFPAMLVRKLISAASR